MRGARLTGLRVLVVEDNPVNQHVLLALLRSIGVEAELVGDGRAAVAACADERFDCVLMDCHMPRMDGYEATERIRAAERVQGCEPVPIHALSADATDGHARRCREVGMDAVLPKPITSDVLADALRGLREPG